MKNLWTGMIFLCAGIITVLYVGASLMNIGVIVLSHSTTEWLHAHSTYTLGGIGGIALLLLVAFFALIFKKGPLIE
jgi:hypothetical protein